MWRLLDVGNMFLHSNNIICLSYLKEYNNMKSVNQAVLFTNRRFTSADMVKQLVKSIRFYYVTKEGYENSVDYQMSQLGNEVALFDNYYTNVTYETYPYGYSSGQDNVTGQIPGISGATY